MRNGQLTITHKLMGHNINMLKGKAIMLRSTINILLLLVVVVLVNMSCERNNIVSDGLCTEDNQCFNAIVKKNLSKLCQYNIKCKVPVSALVYGKSIDTVYFVNKYGAHPNLGSCQNIPTSNKFNKTARFGCEYIVFSQRDKFVGYVIGACDKSIVEVDPSLNKIIFSDVGGYPAIKINADEMINVEREKLDENNETDDVYYFGIVSDSTRVEVVKDKCLHF